MVSKTLGKTVQLSVFLLAAKLYRNLDGAYRCIHPRSRIYKGGSMNPDLHLLRMLPEGQEAASLERVKLEEEAQDSETGLAGTS